MKTIKTQSLHKTLAFAACFAAGTLGAQHAHADVIGTDKARTIQVKETYLKADKEGKLEPVFRLVIKIDGPKKIRVDATPANKKKSDAFYVVNGEDEHEFFIASNTYRIIDPTPSGHSSSQIRRIASIDLLMNPLTQEPEGNGKVTISQETMEGRPTSVRTEVQPEIPNPDGSITVYSDKTWTDNRTDCPIRRTAYVTQNGKTSVTLELRFSNWAINKSIPAKEFAFTLPADSKPMGADMPKLLTAGTVAPDFEVITAGGKKVHLSDFKGKTVVLDFWATWCMPCQQAMPHLEKVYQQGKEKDFVVLAVCVWDKRKEFDSWVKANIGSKYNFPVAFDPITEETKSIARLLYHVSGIPAQYVIDKEGKIAEAISGGPGSDHKLEESLRKLGVEVALLPQGK